MNRSIITLLALAAAAAAGADNIPNPLLPNVADIGVMKYNGKYYLGGCRTDGDFYISSDLTHWSGPVHVIDMNNEWSRGSGCGNNQIHANDMLYDNGTVHAYWSVNYWGNDLHAVHIVHSEASDPMGPYAEPVRDVWVDNRIDPKVFRDDDGSMYMYAVRFTDGNTIWARRMLDWGTFDEESPDAMVCQFSSNPNSWERMDNAVAEGPWVLKYHGKYYMMYNANHTGGDWGNYQLGVAQASSPMGFNNANKYPHPVVLSNQKTLEDEHVDLLRYSTGSYEPMFAYSTSVPEKGWEKADFDDSQWLRGSGGFADRSVRGSTTYRRGTAWTEGDLRLRKSFDLASTDFNPALRLTSRGPVTVYLNGKKIHSEQQGVYRIVNFTPEMKKALRKGRNVLALECKAGGRRESRYVNAELFDMGRGKAPERIVWTPGQPNILRGPNGFEWWLIYMANDDARTRSQYIDRVHFQGDKLCVDGISHADNDGYHPCPAKPSYSETFDGTATDTSAWRKLDVSRWQVADGELKAAPGSSAVLAPDKAAQSYLWEVNVRPGEDAGVYAAWVDDANYVKVLFSPASGCWRVVECVGGKLHTLHEQKLRDDFRSDAYHQIRVERDCADLLVSIDELRHNEPIVTSLSREAVPGLFTTSGSAFDGLVYTIGFDDGNDRMNGWATISGTLEASDRGARATAGTRANKGKAAKGYEFTTQISGLLGAPSQAGVYPLYVDERNYVSALFDSASQSLKVECVRGGKTVWSQSVPLDYLRTLYADMRFTDSVEKGYTLDCPTLFDAIYLKRYDIANRNIFTNTGFDKDTPTVSNEIFVDDMFALMRPELYKGGGKWQGLDCSASTVDTNPLYNVLKFEPMPTSRLRFINREATDLGHHIYDIRVHELFKDSYNIRAVREADSLRLFVDGRELCNVPVSGYPASTIGLIAEQGSPEYHGLLYYHK